MKDSAADGGKKKMMLIDAHTHLHHYESNFCTVLDEIQRHMIMTVSVSMDLPSYEHNLEMASLCDLVIPTFGIHPWNAPQYVDRLPTLSPMIDQSPMLGEIGLDFHWVDEPECYSAQRKVFDYFLRAAREQGKIVNLHTKGAEKEILFELERNDIRRAIIHWYSGPRDILREYVAAGALFTLGPELLISDRIRNIAREIPMAQLLVETDNPGAQEWLIGREGMPGLLIDVVEELAHLKGTSFERMRCTLNANFAALIQNDPFLSRWYERAFGGVDLK